MVFNFTTVLLSQSADTTMYDTLIVPVSSSDNFYLIGGPVPDVFRINVPTCSCLKLKNDKFYLENDTIPYYGACVLTNKPNNEYFSYEYPISSTDHLNGKYYISKFFIFYIGEPKYIKIISNYIDGKRNGNREYYDKSGKLIKTEVYDNGVLIKTMYP